MGRATDLALAGAALGGGGCVIAGAAGVGKSRLAAELAGQAGGPVERVLATASARGLPFGALSHLLDALTSGGAPEIPSFLAGLRTRHPDGDVILLVDDAHLLDDASAALLHAVAQARAARLLLTIRSQEPGPDAVTSLWKDRRLERIDLRPLSRADTALLIEALLGAGCHTSVVAKVFELTEGSPLYVTELLRDAVASQALAPVDGRWCWTGHRPVLARLRDLIATRTGGLGPGARRALELLALSAPIGLDLVGEVVERGAVEELERAGLVRVSHRRGSTEVEVSHPLYGEVVVDAMPGGVSREHQRRLAGVLRSRAELSGDEVVKAATWMLASGEVDHDLFVRASQEALRATSGVPGMGWGPEDADLAISLADAAGPSFAATMAAALGRLAVNRGREVEELLAPFEVEASGAASDIGLAYVRARAFGLYWGAAEYEEALALLDRAAGWHRGRPWAAFLAMVRGWVHLERAQPWAGRAATEPYVDGHEVDPIVHLELLVVYGLSIARLGLVDRCEALESEVRRLAGADHGTGVGTAWAAHLVDAFARVEALRDVDEVGARLGTAHRAAQRDGNEALAASIQMVLGRQALLRGHVVDAVERLGEAVDGMVYGAERTALGLAHTYLARAHCLRADAPAAAEHVSRAAGLLRERPRNARLAVELHRAQAWLDAARGSVTDASRRLLEVADEAGEDVTSRCEALYGALRLGADPRRCATELEGAVAAAENPLYVAASGHARSVADDDPVGQLEAAAAFAALGADLFAAEAATWAAQVFVAQGGASRARRAVALAERHAGRCQGAVTPGLRRRPHAVPLTAREHEVAELAARGLANREIAEQLTLSVRTVESYVLRACTKLGVGTRRDLAPLLDADPSRIGADGPRMP